MADVNANIHIGIDATQALGQLRALQSQISAFNRSVASGNAAAAATQAAMASSLASMVGATGQFNTSIRTMESGVASLGTAFDKGTLSARQYFRYAGSQMPGLTRAFKSLGAEQAQMADLATDRVKRLQTQYVALGKDVRGMQKVMAITPKNLATGYATDLAVAQQRQQLFNRALQLGSTGLVNWGKNTQWAGRQLMVGFTVPLTIAAGAAAKFFMELDKASMQFRRVYGDMNTSTEETYRNLEAIKALGVEYTKYGMAVKDVIDVGARVAATGQQNEDLLAGTEETLRLATLGQMEYGRALDAVTSLQTAFSISAEDLGNKINFLNAVENQTVLTMEDMAAAVPRVAPVIKGLGGDVEDLAVFMTALREGGVSAEQGANALKSGLASLINPTSRAQESLQQLGINIKEIVQANKGDLMGTVRAFGEALNNLGEFERQQALETVFGKYQYARLGALFKNIANDASQSARAMELAGSSIEELRGMAEKELAIVSETVTNQFLGAIERLKVAIAPIGEMFLKVVTPVINAVSAIADAFNQLPDGVKTAIGAVVGIVGGLAPVFLMGIGLIGNAIGNGIKFILSLRNGVKSLAATLTGSGANFKYQSGAALDAAAAMTSLEGRVTSLTGDLLMQEGAVNALIGAYRGLASAASGAAAAMPRGFAMPGMPVGRPGGLIPPIKMATGGMVPGTGNKDTVPAMLTPGESVVTKEATAKYGPVIAAMNAGALPGFMAGVTNAGGPTPGFEIRGGQSYMLSGGAIFGPGNQSVFGLDRDFIDDVDQFKKSIQGSLTGGALVVEKEMGTISRTAQMTSGYFSDAAKVIGPASQGIAEEISAVQRHWQRAGVEIRDITQLVAMARPGIEARLRQLEATGTVQGVAAAEAGRRFLFNPPSREDLLKYGEHRAAAATATESGRVSTTTRRMTVPAPEAGHLLSPIRTATRMAFGGEIPRGFQYAHLMGQPVVGPTYPYEGGAMALPQRERDILIREAEAYARRSPTFQRSLDPGVEAVAMQRGEQAARATGVGARTQSPSVTTQQVGRDINSGLVLGMESTAGQVTAAGQASGLAATQGVRAAATSSLDDIERLMKQRMSMFGNEFEDGRAIGATMPIQRQISDNLSRKQMARGREQVAWRQFSGSLGGLAAVIATGPVADIQKFASGEAKKFRNQIKSGLGAMKRGLNTIGTSVLNAGVSMVAKIPNDPGAVASGAFRSSMNKVLDNTIPAAFNAIDRGAAQMKKLGVLASDMGQALMYRDVKSATKMLANSIGGTAAIKPIVDSSKNLGNAIKSNWQTLRSATRDVVTTFNALGAVDAARMARNIVGLDEVGRSIRNTASGVVNNVRTFGSTVGSAFKDIRTIFRSEGFRAAGQMAAQISGVTQSWNTAKTSFKTMMQDARDIALGSRALGKEMLVNARQSMSDAFRNVGASIANASVRSFDRALGGWQGMKQSFAGIGTAFKTAGIDGANAIRASLKSAAASISSGASSVATFLRGGIDPMTGRRMGFMQKQGGAMSGIGMVGSMASMIPFMMQDEQGQFMGMNANAVGMGMMGGFGLLSVLPMLGPKVAIITAAVAAAGVAVYAWRNHVDNAARAAADFGANIGRSANVLNNVADMLGQATPAQRQTQMKLSFTEEEQQQAFGEFQGMFETEAGKKFIEDLKDATAPKRFELLSDYIKTAVASGMMDTETAKLFAKTVASSLEDAVLGTAIISEINKGLTKGAEGLLELARTRDFATQRTTAMAEIQTQDGISYENASLLVGASLQNIQDFSNAAALAKEEYMNGTISFNEYIDIVNQAADAQARYSSVLNQAITKTGDIGATAQALKDQLGLIVSPEDLGRVQEAANIDTNFFKAFAAQVIPGLAPALGVPATTEEKMKLEQETIGRMAEAIFSGMNAATVAAIQQYMKQNPESRANEVFADLEGQGGFRQFQGAALAANADTMQAMGMLSEWEKGVYIDVGLNFLQSGGNLEDYQTFINTLPEEKRVKVITEFSGMTPQQQQQFITNFQAMSGLIGAENATAVREANAARAEQEALSRPDVSDVPRRKTRAASDVRTQTRENLFNERSLRAIERAKESGVFENLESTISLIMKEDPSDLETRLPDLEEKITAINDNIPSEMQKTLGIDVQNLDDVDKYGPMAVELGQLVSVVEGIEDQQVKDLAINMMYKQNGKPKDVMSFAKDVNQLKKNMDKFRSIDISDVKARKNVAVEIVTTMTGPQGMQMDGEISEADVNKALQHVLDLTGLTEAEFFALPDDVIIKTLKYGVDSTQFSAAAARLEAAANAAAKAGVDDPETARAIERWRTAASELRAAAQSSDVSATTSAAGGYTSSGGGNSGGGGGGGGGGGSTEKDPLKAMMDDLETQRKLIGDFVKKGNEVKSGFATALRNAGAPEYLIAEIVAKGEDGIKIAKKLLQDKQKKLKELMKLSFDVARLTFIESQRAQANNLRAQMAAQSALVRSGVDASVAMELSPEDAEMVNAAYQRIQQARKAVRDAEGKDRKKARKELEDATKEWQQLTGSIKNTTKAQEKFNDEQAQLSLKAGVKEQRQVLSRQAAALTRLMAQGFTFDKAQEFAGDDTFARAINSAGRAADSANQKYNKLNEQLVAMGPRTKKNAKEWDALNQKVQKAKEEADILSKKYKSLITDLQNLTKEQKANLVVNTKAEYEGLTGQLGNQLNILQKLVDSGMSYAQAVEIASDPQKALAFQAALDEGSASFDELIAKARAFEAATAKFSLAVKLQEFNDAVKKQGFLNQITTLMAGNQFGGMVTDYLMGLSTAELQEFFNQTPEWRQQFVSAFLDSIPLAEKLKYLFEDITAEQRYQSLLNKDKANKDKGNIDSLDDQLDAQKKLLKVEQDRLKPIQKTIDAIQEQNDDLNRGLELISRQEEDINQAFDERIEALDKVERANERIAQQQQGQLDLAQALATGDIYAATQAAQQIKQDNAAAAIENTRNALEETRQQKLKNLLVEVNGQLLTREDIENRIEANNDRIYQLQEDQIEPIQAAIDKIQDEIDRVEDLKTAWQDYFEWLEDNAVDPNTGMKFSDLEKIKAYYDAIVAANPLMSAQDAFNQALARYVAAGGNLKNERGESLEPRLRGYFNIPNTPTQGSGNTGGNTGGGTGNNTGTTPGDQTPTPPIPGAPTANSPYEEWRAYVARWTGLTGSRLTEETRKWIANARKNAGMFAGGVVPGLTPRDSVPIMASPGEFVVRNAMVKKYGLPMLNEINQGSLDPKFNLPNQPSSINVSKNTVQLSSAPTMYNNTYSISVTANTNASADEIANVAVAKIRQINSMQIRGARG